MREKNRRFFPQKCRPLKGKKRLNLTLCKLNNQFRRKITATKLTIRLEKSPSLLDVRKYLKIRRVKIVKIQMISLVMRVVKMITKRAFTKFNLRITISTNTVLASDNHRIKNFKRNLKFLHVQCQLKCQKVSKICSRKLSSFQSIVQKNFIQFFSSKC
jgi:ERCC4-related helicase